MSLGGPRRALRWRFASDVRAALLAGLFATDVAVVVGAGIAASLVWYGTPYLPARFWAQVAIGGAILLPLMQIAGMYRFAALHRRFDHAARLTGLWAAVVVALMAVIYLGRLGDAYSRAWMLLWAMSAWLGLLTARVLVWQVIRRLRSRGELITHAVVVGSGAAAERCARRLQEDGNGDVKVLGVFDGNRASPDLPGAGFDELARLRARTRIDEIVLALPCDELLEAAAPLGVINRVAADVKIAVDFVAASARVGHAPLIVVPVKERPLAGLPTVVKRVFDICISAVLLAFVLPLIGLIAAFVKLDSRGPVLFRQRRFGLNKQPFVLYKFRSMRCEACGDPTVPQARRHDPRVTRVGRFLRRTSLDELPQLFNVLTGHMSLVGPRPHAIQHDEKFAALIDGYLARHRVKPGITGWAQVHGLRGETDTLEKIKRRVEYDLYYIDNWSLLLDMRILAKTLGVVVNQRNAY